MKLADSLATRSAADQSRFWARVGLLGNLAAFEEESRVPADIWDATVKGVVGLPEPVRKDAVKTAIQQGLEPWILSGPESTPVPGFIERVGNARSAVFAQRYSGVAASEIENDWEEFLKLVGVGDLGDIRKRFATLLLGRRPMWGTPFPALTARPFEGVGIAELCRRLALGRPPAADGNDWVFWYTASDAPAPRIPTVADACGGGNWHEPFFPAAANMTVGQTKPQVPGILPFFEVVHQEISWQRLTAVPEQRTE